MIGGGGREEVDWWRRLVLYDEGGNDFRVEATVYM